MHAYPKKFADEVIAEMRGVMTDEGHCPFWEAIGRHFFDLDFPQADNLSTLNKRFIEDLMPRYPIYTNLLSAATRAIMGDVHENTRPALAMLEAEGFVKTDLIDIFDGGPVVRCRRAAIDAVRRTSVHRVAQISEKVEAASGDERAHIVASLQTGFRAATAPIAFVQEELVIGRVLAEQLRVQLGDSVRITPLYPTRPPSQNV